MSHTLRYAANCSMLFTELPLLERPTAAKEAGFSAIEFWWPWPVQPVPPDALVDEFVDAIREADIPLIGLNFFAGDLAGPDAGVLSLPDRSSEFRDNIAVVAGIGQALGVAGHNALYGNRIDGVPPEQQDELATENLILAAEAIAAYSATVLVEPVSGPKPYPLRTADDVIAVVDRVGRDNVGFLCDLFHLANNGDDVDAALDRYGSRIAHVQIADHPGRGEPGSGQLELDRYLTAIAAGGYSGYVAAEYKPTTTTSASLGWLNLREGSSS
jgi:hydroxypyruvate isomerase